MPHLLRVGEVNDIVEMKRQGLSVSVIGVMTGFDRKTIRKYLADPKTPRYGLRQRRASKLDAYKDYVDERLDAGVWNAVVLLSELRSRGYAGGYSILKDYISPKRRAACEVCVRRFETPPGHQAQADWGRLGYLERDGRRSKISSFVLTLGNSRGMFADVWTDQKLETLLRMHEEAFRQLGGVPEEILYDRMKTVVVDTDERGETRWHPVFADFARYWGFVGCFGSTLPKPGPKDPRAQLPNIQACPGGTTTTPTATRSSAPAAFETAQCRWTRRRSRCFVTSRRRPARRWM